MANDASQQIYAEAWAHRDFVLFCLTGAFAFLGLAVFRQVAHLPRMDGLSGGLLALAILLGFIAISQGYWVKEICLNGGRTWNVAQLKC